MRNASEDESAERLGGSDTGEKVRLPDASEMRKRVGVGRERAVVGLGTGWRGGNSSAPSKDRKAPAPEARSSGYKRHKSVSGSQMGQTSVDHTVNSWLAPTRPAIGDSANKVRGKEPLFP